MNDLRQRPASDEYFSYYDRYIARVPDGDIVATLRSQFEGTVALLRSLPSALHDYAYGDGKWTVKEVVGHVADTERVMSHRALRFGRADRTPLPSFDENEWMPPAEFGTRSLESVLAELAAVRQATLALFANLPAAAWERDGEASGHRVTVRALAWIIAGHETHHVDILRKRYLVRAPEIPQ